MKSKSFFWLLTTVLLTTAFPADAQQPKKVPRIGYLSATDPAGESSRSEVIRLVLRPRWGERLSTHTWRVKIFSNTAQISGIYTVATSQTMCKSTLA
jgi:hypothetical protein